MEVNDKDLYFVAVKVFLVDSQNRLLIIKDIHDDGWDLSGGWLKGVQEYINQRKKIG